MPNFRVNDKINWSIMLKVCWEIGLNNLIEEGNYKAIRWDKISEKINIIIGAAHSKVNKHQQC